MDLNHVNAWMHLLMTGCFAIGLVVWPLGVSRGFKIVVTLLSLSVFLVTLAAFSLRNTPFALNGLGGDAGFMTAMVQKFAHNVGWRDFVYKDLPAFYPPLYFWVLGLGARLTGTEPAFVLKPGLLVVSFILPWLTFLSWRRVVSHGEALAATFVILFVQEWYKPGEWLVALLIIPWWIYYVHGYKLERRARWWWSAGLAIGALVLALLFMTYYFFFIPLAFSFPLYWLLDRLAPPTEGTSVRLRDGGGVMLRLAVTAVLSSPYWLPYLLTRWTHNNWILYQNQYEPFSGLFLELIEPKSPGDWLALGGLFTLLMDFRSSDLSRHLLAMFLSIYLFIIASWITLLLGFPLLPGKAHHLFTAVLVSSAFMGLFRGAFGLGRQAFAGQRLIVGVSAILLLIAGATRLASLPLSEFVLSSSKYWLNHRNVSSSVYSMTRDEPIDYSQAVLLTDDYRVVLVYPAYLFVAWSKGFGHPAADLDGRCSFLRTLETVSTSAEMHEQLTTNKFDVITHILVHQSNQRGEFYELDLCETRIKIRRSAVAGPAFRARTSGAYTLISTRGDQDQGRN